MIYYLFVVNIVNFFLYGFDKFFAKKGKRRICEEIFYFFSFIGGGLFGLLGMKFFRHKTLKKRFYIINILGIVMWVYILFLLYSK